jgi:hypothetical protein
VIALAVLVLLLVGVVALAAARRPLSERAIDALYWLAHRLTASARAADCGLVAYRREREALADRHWPEYAR